MATTIARQPFATLIVAIAFLIAFAHAEDTCYYPNGDIAPEKPCSSAKGSACCPNEWQCLDNGLCYLEHDNLYGRYSCTDEKWEADGCPRNICTYQMETGSGVGGGEDIRQCKSNGEWCCNANAQDVHCCEGQPEPRPFFKLQDGNAYATVGHNMATTVPKIKDITMFATFGPGGATKGATEGSSTPAPSSSADSPKSSDSNTTPDSARPESAPVTSKSVATSVSSGPAGVSTMYITNTFTTTPTAASNNISPPPAKESESSSKIPVIVGCAVGIPLAIALVGILAWLLRKRHLQNKHKGEAFSDNSHSPDFAGGAALRGGSGKGEKPYAPESNVPELMGQSVGPGRPVSTVKGHAELDSGPGFAQGAVPYNPNLVGVGGGNAHGHTPNSSWGSAPPGYSPGMHDTGFAPVHNIPAGVAEAPDTSVVRQEEFGGAAGAVPQQNNVTEGGRYIPYRPPPGHAATTATGGLSNVPEMAEMSAVTTPPAEMGDARTPPAELSTVRTPP